MDMSEEDYYSSGASVTGEQFDASRSGSPVSRTAAYEDDEYTDSDEDSAIWRKRRRVGEQQYARPKESHRPNYDEHLSLSRETSSVDSHRGAGESAFLPLRKRLLKLEQSSEREDMGFPDRSPYDHDALWRSRDSTYLAAEDAELRNGSRTDDASDKMGLRYDVAETRGEERYEQSLQNLSSTSSKDEAPRYCICRSTNGSGFMIACDFCEEWFHGKCVNLTKISAKKIGKYRCPICIKKSRLGESPVDFSSNGIPAVKKTKVKQVIKRSKPKQRMPVKLAATTRRCLNHACGNFVKSDGTYCSDDCSRTDAANKKPLYKRPTDFKRSHSADSHSVSTYTVPSPPARPAYPFSATKHADDRTTSPFDPAEEESIISEIKENPSALDQADLHKLKQIESQTSEIQRRLKKLGDQRAQLEQAIEVALSMFAENSNHGESAEDETSGVMDCVICGQSIASRSFAKHVQNCYDREKLAQRPVMDRRPSSSESTGKTLCNEYNSRLGKRCAYEKDSCPIHTNVKNIKVHKNRICGCPMEGIEMPYCDLLKRDCPKHADWENLQRAALNKDEQFEKRKLQELLDQERKIRRSLRLRYLSAQRESNATIEEE